MNNLAVSRNEKPEPRRYPRLAECKEGRQEEHIALVASLHRRIKTFRNARRNYRSERLAMGKELIALKDTVEHGGWSACYHQHYARSGVTFGTAQRYMRDADKKGVRRLRGAAERGSPAAKERRERSKQKKLELGEKRKQKSLLDGNFRLLTGNLTRLPEWKAYLGEVASTLKDMFGKYNCTYPETVKVIEIRSHANTQA